MIAHDIAVCSLTAEKNSDAEKLAAQLHLPYLTDIENKYDYLLIYTSQYLGLHKKGEDIEKPFHIDFLSSKILYRIQQASLRKELLARAMGMHPSEHPVIVDTTAGLGRDSFILASLGYHVTLIERSPILHALLTDAMERAKKNIKISPIIERMNLIHANSIEWLSTQNKVDIIYLDPMFPERKKSASVKKEMVVLQYLLGKDTDSEQLFQLALSCATHRIVVKRPRLAESLAHHTPNFSLTGKNSRFDIYLG